MKKKSLGILVLLIISTSLFLYFQAKNDKKDDGILTLYGNVDIRQVNLGFRISGRLKKMNFEEGDIVKSGEVLAELDKSPFIDDLNKAEGELETSQANFQKFKNGSRPEEIKQAQAIVNERQAAYENALTLFERQKALAQKGAVSSQDYDNALSQKNQAEARLKTAKEALKLALEGFRKEDIQIAKAQVATANAKLSSAKTNLRDTEIIAPNEGVILTRIQEPGAIINAGSPVYTLSLKSPIWVRTYVSEKELGYIKPGMKAKVITDSRPDKPYIGHIGFISPVAEFTPKSVETTSLRTDLVYRLRIIVSNPDEWLRQGMPVTVRLLTEKSDVR